MSARKRVFDKDLGVELVLDDDVVDEKAPKNKRNDPNDQLDVWSRKRTKYEPTQSNQSSSSHKPSLTSVLVEKHDCSTESKLDEAEDSENFDDIDYGDDEDDDEFSGVQKPCEKSELQNEMVSYDEDDEHENIEHDQCDDKDQESSEQGNFHDQEKEDQQGEEGNRSEKEPMEKCKFWPSCNAGEECAYYHPTKPCRAFPNCRFGKKCLYMHPPCKFNPNCTRLGCPFSHPGTTANTTATKRVGHFKSVQQPLAPKCKYGFQCKNLMCKFSHQRSEPCRFGANCLLDTCAYTHPSDVARKKPSSTFKWSAQS